LPTHLIKTKNYDNNEGDSVNNFDMQSTYYMRENFPKILKLLPPSGTLKVFSDNHHLSMSSL